MPALHHLVAFGEQVTTADDPRDLRDALDSIAHGALPRWGKPTTKMGEEAQVAAREVYERWVRALHHESAAKFAIAKAQVAESDHRTHAHAMTERCETVERERDEARAESARLQERVATQDDGLRYGEKVCADLMTQIEGLRGKLDALATAHERDLIAIWRVLGNYHEPPSSSESVIDAVQLMRDERRQLRARLVECRPWVGVVPYPNTPGFSEMIAIRDLADDTLEEVE
jgi:hypothetical protein